MMTFTCLQYSETLGLFILGELDWVFQYVKGGVDISELCTSDTFSVV